MNEELAIWTTNINKKNYKQMSTITTMAKMKSLRVSNKVYVLKRSTQRMKLNKLTF